MNRPNARQRRRIAIQAATIAAVEAGIDQLETVATNAGLHPLAVALNIAAAAVTATVIATLDGNDGGPDGNSTDHGHNEPEQARDDDSGT
ncbi:hypothetical protein BH92_27510 (plasmid) [Rhodococcoides fascians A21d2]|uniref:hypothetical protein n=1 Tax=Rhodococcoides fascians TaxID=1828 RepID=UPI00056D2BFF|nr:hypothetical protein [Rhodococcus fascians]QII03811.1 hypothetical protein BH92_27510 [Rhodococcus fascians A21d2]